MKTLSTPRYGIFDFSAICSQSEMVARKLVVAVPANAVEDNLKAKNNGWIRHYAAKMGRDVSVLTLLEKEEILAGTHAAHYFSSQVQKSPPFDPSLVGSSQH